MKFVRFQSYEHLLCSLVCFLAGVMIVGWCLIMPGCSQPAPVMHAQFWAGDSAKGGITRAQENRTIRCIDTQMDEYVCATYKDIQVVFETLTKCKEWPK